ncbi:MAG: TetR/AcrR family transcriptional regulator C-terminal domain-containing protein [Acidimicrobiia bacterium]
MSSENDSHREQGSGGAAKRVGSRRRAPLNRDRVLRAAVSLADAAGIEALSMRNLAQELGVVPMALYKHVKNKEELLDGMVDFIVGEIDVADQGTGWKDGIRYRILSARQALLRHRWASQVIESRANASPVILDYMNSLIGMFRAGGFSVDLTHHVMHALGSRMWGFTQEVFPTPPPPDDPEVRAAMFGQLAAQYPYIIEVATAETHDEESAVGQGCDDQFEFEFALDLLLGSFDQLHQQGRNSTEARSSTRAG